MATVSFFCTRCRRLTTFPASRRGAVVYCPRCQQALIVPDIPAVGGDGEEEPSGDAWGNGGTWGNSEIEEIAGKSGLGEIGGNDAEIRNGEERARGVELNGGSARRVGATIASHLSPEKKRPENWRRLETEDANGWNGAKDEDDAVSFWAQAEVSDAEFLRRLRSEEETQSEVEPEFARYVGRNAASEAQEDADGGGIPKLVWAALGVAMLGSAFVFGAFWGGKAKNGEQKDATDVGKQVAKETVFVEGALTHRTASGANAPDDGAFVFLFPTDERWDAPIALGDVSPQRPNSPGFETVVAELEARGARFAVADFEGRFAFDDLEPGEYRVLLVSRRVGDDWRKANPAALKEIERCVVSPRLLLGRSRFFWTTRRFDRDAATLEKSFGKAGAPFSNVE